MEFFKSTKSNKSEITTLVMKTLHKVIIYLKPVIGKRKHDMCIRFQYKDIAYVTTLSLGHAEKKQNICSIQKVGPYPNLDTDNRQPLSSLLPFHVLEVSCIFEIRVYVCTYIS